VALPTNQRVILLQPDSDNVYHEMLVDSTGRPLAPSNSNQSLVEVVKAQDFISWLGLNGKTFSAGPSTATNATVTGQTSFASTTPTFLLNVPSGKTAIPLYAALCQTGTVAGGDITIVMAKDKINRYSSGGTALSAQPDRPSKNTNPSCTLYTSPTAISGIALRMAGIQVAADISPAEGVINEWVWTPAGKLDYIDGPGAWMIYTYAGTTGPTWFYSFGWAEVDSADLP